LAAAVPTAPYRHSGLVHWPQAVAVVTTAHCAGCRISSLATLIKKPATLLIPRIYRPSKRQMPGGHMLPIDRCATHMRPTRSRCPQVCSPRSAVSLWTSGDLVVTLMCGRGISPSLSRPIDVGENKDSPPEQPRLLGVNSLCVSLRIGEI
jgi:hypothetical protein